MTSTQTTIGFVLAFIGGAAVGAAAVYASDPENRKKMRAAADSAQRMAGRVPLALKDVGAIASDALSDARDGAKEALHDAGNAARQIVGPQPAPQLRNGAR